MAQHEIIQFLRSAQGYISGEEISRQLKISRAAIWKHMQSLRDIGYEIEAVPHLGYRLASSPDKLIADEILHGLTTKTFGRNIIAHDSVDSTMDEAFHLGMDGAVEGTIICAETQTKGRGRLGRSWMSPKGKGIYFSLILRPRLSPNQMPQLTLMAAVSIAQAIKKNVGVAVAIKWPNDLLIDGKKVAGILTELRAEVDQMKFVVLGVGINVNSSASQLIETATSLKTSSGNTIDRVELLQEVLSHLERWYQSIHKGDFSKVLAVWRELSCTLHQRVRVTDGYGAIEGVAVDLDHDGALLIKQDDGKIIRRLAGDVIQLR